MKKIVSFLAVLCAMWTVCADVKDFKAEEVYVGYYLFENYANVIEYNLVHDSKGDREKDTEELVQSVQNGTCADERFGFERFKSAEECISNEEDFVKVNYDLICNEDASLEVMKDLFSKTLGRKVKAAFEDDMICLSFDGTGIDYRNSNAEKAYKKENTILLMWPNRLSCMEIVFDRKVDGTESILDLVHGKTSSPEKSAEEIDAMKNSSSALDEVERKYQDDCDVVRLQHLEYYGELIEEYKQKTGAYPFAEKNVKTYALIYNKKQKKYAKDTNPDAHKLVSPAEFFKELEKGLGREIDQKFDAQYVPTTKPVFYIYMADGDSFYFAVHLSKYYPFSKKVAANYYKVELSDVTDEKNKFYTVSDLEKREDFINASSMEMGGYFDKLYNEHKREYK